MVPCGAVCRSMKRAAFLALPVGFVLLHVWTVWHQSHSIHDEPAAAVGQLFTPKDRPGEASELSLSFDEGTCSHSQEALQLIDKLGLRTPRPAAALAWPSEEALRDMLAVYVLSMPGSPRWENATKHWAALGIPITMCEGVYASREAFEEIQRAGFLNETLEYPIGPGSHANCGDLGATLAHVRCMGAAHKQWLEAGKPPRIILIAEDDEWVKPAAFDQMKQLLLRVDGAFDWLALNVKRPFGLPVDRVYSAWLRLWHVPWRGQCPRQIWKQRFKPNRDRFIPNAWNNAAYALNPASIPTVLSLFELYPWRNTYPADLFMSPVFLMLAPFLRVFVSSEKNALSDHDASVGPSRTLMNKKKDCGEPLKLGEKTSSPSPSGSWRSSVGASLPPGVQKCVRTGESYGLIERLGLRRARPPVRLGAGPAAHALLDILKVYILTMPGSARWENATRHWRMLGVPVEQCPGVYATREAFASIRQAGFLEADLEYPIGPDSDANCGDLGATLAHVRCMGEAHREWIAEGRPERVILIAEDDEYVKPVAFESMASLLRDVDGSFDWLALNVKRPFGLPARGQSDAWLQVSHIGWQKFCPQDIWNQRFRPNRDRFIPNAWNNAGYALNPASIPTLLRILELYPWRNTYFADLFMSPAFLMLAPFLRVFVSATKNALSDHDSSVGPSKTLAMKKMDCSPPPGAPTTTTTPAPRTCVTSQEASSWAQTVGLQTPRPRVTLDAPSAAALHKILKVYILGTSGTAGWQNATRHWNTLGVPVELCEGVYASPEAFLEVRRSGLISETLEYPIGPDSDANCGDLGATLTHLRCMGRAHEQWVQAGKPPTIILIAEDSERLRPAAFDEVARIVRDVGGQFDWLALSAERPFGIKVQQTDGHWLRVYQQSWQGHCPEDLWNRRFESLGSGSVPNARGNAAYALNPAVIPAILKVFDEYPWRRTPPADVFLSPAFLMLAPSLHVYVSSEKTKLSDRESRTGASGSSGKAKQDCALPTSLKR